LSNQNCPICKKLVKANPRYPNYVCNACLADGVEVNGSNVLLSNIDLLNNLEVECFINGVKYTAQEARFGGAVV
jgi:hypothetical protein